MNGTLPNAVVIEDDRQIRRFVTAALEGAGWRVYEAATLRDGLVEAGVRRPELVILDLGLPDGDGADFIPGFRAWSTAPIIVLSARAEDADKIGALDAGADDYLSKPFSLDELLARVRAARRRSVPQEGGAARFDFGDVVIDLAARSVTRAGQHVHLTPTEYRLLCVLAANVGKVLTHRFLLREVWGAAYVDQAHYVRIQMAHLRQKLEADPAQPQHLLTETAVGYRLVKIAER